MAEFACVAACAGFDLNIVRKLLPLRRQGSIPIQAVRNESEDGKSLGRVDMDLHTLLVETTRVGVPQGLPITHPLAATLERQRTAADNLSAGDRDGVFPCATSSTGLAQDSHHLNDGISKAGGAI